MRSTDRSQLAIVIAVVLASLTLTPLTSDLTFLGASWLLVGLLAVVSVVIRRLGVGEAVVLVGQLVVLVVYLVVLSLGMSGSGGLLSRIVTLFADGAEHMQSEAAPMSPNEGVRLMLVSAVGLIAVLTDLLVVGVHRAAWSLAPLATLFLIPALGLNVDTGPLAFIAVAVGYLGILVSEGLNRAARWTRNLTLDSAEGYGAATPVVWRAAAYIGIPAAALSLVVAPLLPTLSLTGFGIGDGSGAGGPLQLSDPTLDLRRNLRQQSNREVITYRTSTGEGEYLRMASLPVFSSAGWQIDRFSIVNGSTLPAIPGRNTPKETETTTVSIGDFTSQYLPLPYAPRSFDAAGSWGSDAASLQVVTRDSTATIRNLQYRVVSADVSPTASQLGSAISGAPQDAATTSKVPDDLPDSLVRLSRQVTADEPTAAGKAAAIQSWLRNPDRFTYDTTPAPGNGYQTLERFLLDDRRGYCEQFAASMAMMARVVGIPSRVAIGFLPGEKRGNTFHVRLKDMHAWPELYFAGLGWVRYDPTPGVANAPSWSQPVTAPTLNPTDDPTTDPTDIPSNIPSAPTGPTEAPVTTTTDTGTGWLRPLGFSALGLVVLVLLSLPATIRVRRRTARLDTVGAAGDRVEGAWAEIRDTVVDLGGRWPDGSPKTIGSEVSRRLDADSSAEMTQLATLVERSRYSRGLDPDDLPADLSSLAVQIRHGLTADKPWPRKLLAVLAPRSLARSLTTRFRRH